MTIIPMKTGVIVPDTRPIKAPSVLRTSNPPAVHQHEQHRTHGQGRQ
ncbi:hypothetical protein [Brevibacillus agri]